MVKVVLSILELPLLAVCNGAVTAGTDRACGRWCCLPLNRTLEI
jgi:hypothetical protein